MRIEVGDMYMFKKAFQLLRVFRVTRRRVYYTDGTGFFAAWLSHKEFEQKTIRVFAHLRRNRRQGLDGKKKVD